MSLGSILGSIFAPKPVYQPFKAITERMREKDAALYEDIRSMPLADGARRWKAKYPEDFPELPKVTVYDGIGHIALLSGKYRGTMLSITEQINNHVRHARIGKITLKAAA